MTALEIIGVSDRVRRWRPAPVDFADRRREHAAKAVPQPAIRWVIGEIIRKKSLYFLEVCFEINGAADSRSPYFFPLPDEQSTSTRFFTPRGRLPGDHQSGSASAR